MPETFKPPTAWSFSRLNDYNTCPAKFKFKHLMKLPEPGNAAMNRGSEIHKLAESYLKGDIAKLPPELVLFKAEFQALRKLYKSKKLPMVVEDAWAFTKEWDQTQWNDWVKCFVRIKLDCAHFIEEGAVLVVTDWKTGKFREEQNADYMQQLELYALAAMLVYPNLQCVRPRLGYIDAGEWFPKTPIEYTRDRIPELKKLWEGRVKPLFNDKRWAPKPNRFCQQCHYRKSNDGPCQY